MTRFCQITRIRLNSRQLISGLGLLSLIFFSNAWGDACTDADHHVDFDACNVQSECTFALHYDSDNNIAVPAEIIQTLHKPSSDPANSVNLVWARDSAGSCTATNLCLASGTCLGLAMTQALNQVSFGGTGVTTNTGALDANGCFELTATSASIPLPGCKRKYKIHITSSGEGWGDPHITTVNKVDYDFQSVGEFIALRGKGVEIQTRSAPYPTSGPRQDRSGYTNLKNCVSVYSGVAARVGKHRVTIQSSFGSAEQGNPDGPQLRVDGKLVILPPEGIDLSTCDCGDGESSSIGTEGSHEGDCECSTGNTRHVGRIFYVSGTKTIEIDYDSGARLVVVPTWLSNLKMWYFNVTITDTSATKGIMGQTVDKWLPALFDGSSVGEREGDYDKRYAQVYEQFADSWRVKNQKNHKSLFDYKPGESTDNFTNKDWTSKDRTSCSLGSEPVANPLPEAEAQQTCKNVMDENNKANCVYDVEVTGNTGFADAYEQSEQVIPGRTQTKLVQDKNPSSPGKNVTFVASVTRAIAATEKVTGGSVQFVLDGTNVEHPVKLDTTGKASWSTSAMAGGDHEIEAKFLPSGFGEQFRSSSAKVSHTVAVNKWWGSIHAGSTVPSGDFNDLYDPSYSTVLDLEYRFNPKYSFLGLLGYNHFKGTNSGIDDTHWVNVSANIKYYVAKFAATGYAWVNAGAGAYIPDSGSTKGGANVGFGIGGHFNPDLRWEAAVNYHAISTSGYKTKFSVPTVGVSYKF